MGVKSLEHRTELLSQVGRKRCSQAQEHEKAEQIPPPDLKAILDKYGLHMVATHIGGNLQDRDQADGESKILDMVLDYLQHTGANFLMYSGLKDSDPEQVAAEIAMLNWAAQHSLDRGIQLLYHNHNWEFVTRDGATTWDRLMAAATPALKLCPDLGWLHKAEVNLITFLETYKERIGVIHFKDFATQQAGIVDTVYLGDGCVPLREAAHWIEENYSDMWLISEQDNCVGEPADAIAANARFFMEGWNNV